MKRIRFVHRTVHEIHGRLQGRSHPDNPVYEEGFEDTLPDAIADKWLRRGAAVEVTAAAPPATPRVEEPAEDPPAEDPVDPPAEDAPAPPAPAARPRKR